MVKEKAESELKSSEVATHELFLDELTCFTLVQEFLVYKGLNKSSEQLYNECRDKSMDCPSSDKIETAITKEDATAIRGAFAGNNFRKFVKLWDAKIPSTAVSTDTDAWRLLFLSHVKYAIENKENGMEALKSFISRKPITANQNEMLQYYALPYITNPKAHQSFSHLYKDAWSSELDLNIKAFLKRYTKPHNKPRIMQMTCSESHKQMRKKHKQLLHDYQRLLAVTGELTTALESAVRGHTLDLQNTLRTCSTIYPELFSVSTMGSDSMLRRSLVNLRGTEFEVDFRKVKAHLASPENNKTRLLLMQAIRWRITKTNIEEREHMISMIVRHDLLGLRGGFQLLSLLHLPNDTPHPLQQGVARLGNSLASLRTGRDYLSTQPDQVVTLIASCLTGIRPGVRMDEVTSDMLLALLQKLSLRRIQREAMIDADMVEWLIPKLEKCLDRLTPETPTYALEYATALLMNLCLHSRAKQRCVPLSGRALKLLSELLGVAPIQVLPYVNGALFSLLSEPLINQQAKHMGLERLLHFYLTQSEGELSRQLEHILRLHRGDFGPEAADTHSEDEGEADIAGNMEILEEELDAGDPVRANGFELSGEDLLRQQYRLLFPAHGVVTPGPSQQGSLISITSASRLRNPNVPDIPESEYESSSLNSFGGVTAANKFLSGRPKDTKKGKSKDPETDSMQSDVSFAISSSQNPENNKNTQGSGMSFSALRSATRFRKSRKTSVTSENQENNVVEQQESGSAGSGTSFGGLRAASRFLKKKPTGKNTEENTEEIPDNVSETGSRISFGSLRAASRFRKSRNNTTSGENNPENIEEEENEMEDEKSSGGISFGSLRAASRFRKSRNNSAKSGNVNSENPEENEEDDIAEEKSSGGINFGSLKAASRFRKSRNNSAKSGNVNSENPEENEEDDIAEEKSSGGINFGSLKAASRFRKSRNNSAKSGNINTENPEEGEEDVAEEQSSGGISFGSLKAATRFRKSRNNSGKSGNNNTENPEENEAEDDIAEENSSGGISFGSLRAATRFRKSRNNSAKSGNVNSENPEENEGEGDIAEEKSSGGISFGSLRAATRFRKSRNNSAKSGNVNSENPEENEEAEENDTEESISGSKTSFSSLRAASRFLKKKSPGNNKNNDEVITEEASGNMTSMSALRATTRFLRKRPKGGSVAPQLDEKGQPVTSAVGGNNEENLAASTTTLNTQDDPDSDKKSQSSDVSVSLFFSTPRLARTPPTPRRSIVSIEQVDKIANLLFGISHIKQEDPESDDE